MNLDLNFRTQKRSAPLSMQVVLLLSRSSIPQTRSGPRLAKADSIADEELVIPVDTLLFVPRSAIDTGDASVPSVSKTTIEAAVVEEGMIVCFE